MGLYHGQSLMLIEINRLASAIW